MTRSCLFAADERAALVGDPVDAVTGANLDRELDLRLPGPLPLLWIRHHDSRMAGARLPLGRGQTHEYDRSLVFDVDGIRYVHPVGRVVAFPPPEDLTSEATAGGLLLHRVSARLYRLFEPDGTSLEFTASDTARPARLTQLRRGVASLAFLYDHGRLSTIVDSTGRRVHVTSDAEGRITSLSAALGPSGAERTLVKYRYDGDGRLAEGVDAYGHAFRFQWDPAHRLVRRTDRRGYSFLFEYDAAGRCVRSRGEDGLHEVRLEYLPGVTRVTRADGGDWMYVCPGGRLERLVDPYGGTELLEHDASGRLVATVDPNGNVTRVVRDPRTGARRGTVSPLGTFQKEGGPAPSSRPRAPWCPLHWEYGFLYGALRPHEKIRPPSPDAPSVKRLSVTAARWLKTASGPTEDAAWITDELGLRVRQRGPSGSAAERRCTYDPNGSLHRLIDFESRVWTLEHTSWDLRSEVVNPLGQRVSIDHTKTQQVQSVTDRGGSVSRYEYDLKDRLARVFRHGVLREEYRYDAAGNLVEKRDGSGRPLLLIEIGPGNRRKAVRLASGEEHTFAFDDSGRLVGASTAGPAGEARVAIGYDSAGRKRSETIDGLGVETTYDAAGRLNAKRLLGRFEVRYMQSPGRLTIRDPRGRDHTIEIAARGLVFRRMANGSNERSQYDDRGRCLVKLVTRGPARSDIFGRAYTYSAEGDLLSAEDETRGTERFGYGAAHQLVSWEAAGGARHEFHHDAGGNLLRAPGLQNVTLHSGNRLATAAGEVFEHDARNHVSARRGPTGETRYVHDAKDRLVRVERGGRVWEARYDAFGRRVSTRSTAGERRFFWDGERLAAEIAPRGGVRLYVYADPFALTPILLLDYDGLDAPPASGRGHAVYCDHRATPAFLVDDAGRTSWSARVAPYGQAEVEPGASVEMPLRFPGHYADAETGLHYNRFRYYSPELGRYLESDPWGVAGGVNLYAYPANPLRFVDVRGLCPDGPTRDDDPPEDQEGTKPREESELMDALDTDDVEAARLAQEAEEKIQRLGADTQEGVALVGREEVLDGAIVIIGDDPDFNAGVKGDLDRIASTESGQRLLDDLKDNHETSGVQVEVSFGRPQDSACSPLPASKVQEDGTPGQPTGSNVFHAPQDMDESFNRSPETPSDVVLVHELTHAERAGKGQSDDRPATEPGFPSREEQAAVERENEYRTERGLAERKDYSHLP